MRFLLLIFCSCSFFGYSQNENIIHGSVSDFQGLPLPDVEVRNLSNNFNSKSDFDGYFSITAFKGDTLNFHYNRGCLQDLNQVIKTNDSLKVSLLTKKELEYSRCDKFPKELYVFVGKVKKHQTQDEYDYDCGGFIDPLVTSKFKIKEVLYGNYEKEYIVFSTREHASYYRWLDGDDVLINVYKFCNSEYKKQGYYGKVYKTKNNRWAIRYIPNKHKHIDTSILKPIPINFGSLSFKSKKKHFKRTKETLIEPYYTRKGRRFYPEMGYYVEDYFAYWKSQQKDWKYSN